MEYLVASDVAKSFGEVVALESADFELRRSEVMGLVGENGAGKSTFVKILCGMYRRDRGTIRIDGEEVVLGSTTRAERAGIAVVQQELSIVPTLSVAENIFLGQPEARGVMTRKWLLREAGAHLDHVGLDVDPLGIAGDLPLAERQMVEIARVVARDAGMILLDEPTAALADDDIARVHEVVRRLAAAGRSVVYITHRLGEVFEVANRVTVFRDGRSQPPAEVADIDGDELITRMLGRRLSQMFPPRAAAVGDVVLEVSDFLTEGLVAPASLTVRRGEIVGLAGQLGSGATELLRGISGTQPREAGRVLVDGAESDINSPAGALANGVAYCSGDRKFDGFFANRRVLENFTAPGLERITPRNLLSRRLEHRLASSLAGMVSFDTARLRHRVSTLSGGNQQKVTVGKWLGVRPNVLLIDEPTRGVDVGARAEIYQTLRNLADDGLAVVFATSEMHEVLGLADSIVTFFRGRQIAGYVGAEATQAALIRDITHPADAEAGTVPATGR